MKERCTQCRPPRQYGGASELALRSYFPHEIVSAHPEPVFSNLFPVKKVPAAVLRFRLGKRLPSDDTLATKWAFRKSGETELLSFHPPTDEVRKELAIVDQGGALWSLASTFDGIDVNDLLKELLKKSIQVECCRRGLLYCEERRLLYFPSGLLKHDHLWLKQPDGSSSFFAVAGERSYGKAERGDKYRYHIAPVFVPRGDSISGFEFIMRVRVRITDIEGKLYPGHAGNARRKKLCHDWWNHEWLSRTLGVMQFLARDEDSITIGTSETNHIVISAMPRTWTSPVRLNEEALRDVAPTLEEQQTQDRDDDDEGQEGNEPSAASRAIIPIGNERLLFLEEPHLEFASTQVASDPHDGLALYGPFSSRSPSQPHSPSYILAGAPEGLETFKAWAEAMNCGFAVLDPKKPERTPIAQRLWPPYPGFEIAFGSRWASVPVASLQLDREKLLLASRKKDPHERCFAVVEQFMDVFERMPKYDDKPRVAICVVPDEVWLNCRPLSRVAEPTDEGISRTEKKARTEGQTNLFSRFDPDQYLYAPDFRCQLKARTMRYDAPLQIIRESTLRLNDEKRLGERSLTPLSDRMWNLATTLYYKAGGKPWKLRSARDGVCYIGLAFRRADQGPTTACCAAQMFLDSGDGIVFLGEYGPWYSAENNSFHLTRAAAKQLLAGVLKTYHELDGKPLSEIFLHCRSTISAEEFAGYKEACPSGCKIVGIRVRSDSLGPRLFRVGSRPVLRGTLFREHDRAAFLYTSGFKPRIATYDGWETPVPLKIDIQHGEASIDQVARDILALTKLNYSACKLGDSQPVTVGFSDAVGEILISNPTVKDRRPNFKFYI